MTYTVREIYYTLQGEGAQTGRPAVFLRFAGCNLWSGREKDRASAVCRFCDTQFVGTGGPGGGKFKTADELAQAVGRVWPSSLAPASQSENVVPYVVCTGGEPLLQLDSDVIDALHDAGFEIGVETNGTVEAPPGIDWICVSPKAGAEVVQRSGHELKLVYPQVESEAQPDSFPDTGFEHYFLQPLYVDAPDGVQTEENTAAAIRYCLENPRWRLSLQTHKLTGID